MKLKNNWGRVAEISQNISDILALSTKTKTVHEVLKVYFPETSPEDVTRICTILSREEYRYLKEHNAVANKLLIAKIKELL